VWPYWLLLVIEASRFGGLVVIFDSLVQRELYR